VIVQSACTNLERRCLSVCKVLPAQQLKMKLIDFLDKFGIIGLVWFYTCAPLLALLLFLALLLLKGRACEDPITLSARNQDLTNLNVF
jgi:hypothetical protein